MGGLDQAKAGQLLDLLGGVALIQPGSGGHGIHAQGVGVAEKRLVGGVDRLDGGVHAFSPAAFGMCLAHVAVFLMAKRPIPQRRFLSTPKISTGYGCMPQRERSSLSRTIHAGRARSLVM